MNEFQKALDNLKDMQSNLIALNSMNRLNTQRTNDLKVVLESTDKIQELVDKETPMKPILEDGLMLCGKCKNHTIYTNSFQDLGEEWCCYACGQVIDWSDEE